MALSTYPLVAKSSGTVGSCWDFGAVWKSTKVSTVSLAAEKMLRFLLTKYSVTSFAFGILLGLFQTIWGELKDPPEDVTSPEAVILP